MVRGHRLARPPISRSLLLHLAWSGLVLAIAGTLIVLELGSPCPSGGPLALGDCLAIRPIGIGVVGLGAALYVAGLSAVLAWTRGLQRRGADPRGVRDWYLLAALLGLGIAPLLAFTIVSALR